MKLLTILTAVLLGTAVINAETYIYDDAGRLVAVRYENSMETRYTYDKNGNITRIKTDVVNSVTEAETLGRLSVMPVPATNKLVLRNLPAGTVNVSLVSVTGEVVLTKKYGNVGKTITVDIENIPSGVYAVRAANGTAIYVATMVKSED